MTAQQIHHTAKPRETAIPIPVKKDRFVEDNKNYLWKTTMMKMTLELQCFCVALIVMTQVWILVYFGSDVFEKLIGDELALPILYIFTIVSGTITYINPTYWRITLSLSFYCICVYFSMMITNLAIKLLMTPELSRILQQEPSQPSGASLRVWIPWALGFALHMQFCLTALFVCMVSIHDMYFFKPVIVTDQEEQPVTACNPRKNRNCDPIYMIVEASPDNYLAIVSNEEQRHEMYPMTYANPNRYGETYL